MSEKGAGVFTKTWKHSGLKELSFDVKKFCRRQTGICDAIPACDYVHGTERYNALVWLLEKYSSEFIEEGIKYIEKKDKSTKVIKIEIQHIRGKRAPTNS